MTYVYAAVTCRPEWYQPLSVNYQALEDDKRAQHRLENTISAALNADEPIEVTLSQDQLNRWIAARRELWPGETPSIEPFSRPQVVLQKNNRVCLAAQVDYSGVQSVLSAVFQVALKDDHLIVTWDSVHAGALPAPRELLEKAALKAARRLDFPTQSVSDGRVKWPNEWIWPNGKRRFRITELALAFGEIHVRLEPL